MPGVVATIIRCSPQIAVERTKGQARRLAKEIRIDSGRDNAQTIVEHRLSNTGRVERHQVASARHSKQHTSVDSAFNLIRPGSQARKAGSRKSRTQRGAAVGRIQGIESTIICDDVGATIRPAQNSSHARDAWDQRRVRGRRNLADFPLSCSGPRVCGFRTRRWTIVRVRIDRSTRDAESVKYVGGILSRNIRVRRQRTVIETITDRKQIVVIRAGEADRVKPKPVIRIANDCIIARIPVIQVCDDVIITDKGGCPGPGVNSQVVSGVARVILTAACCPCRERIQLTVRTHCNVSIGLRKRSQCGHQCPSERVNRSNGGLIHALRTAGITHKQHDVAKSIRHRIVVAQTRTTAEQIVDRRIGRRECGRAKPFFKQPLHGVNRLHSQQRICTVCVVELVHNRRHLTITEDSQRVGSAGKFDGSHEWVKCTDRAACQVVCVSTFLRSGLIIGNVGITTKQNQATSRIINRHSHVSTSQTIGIVEIEHDRNVRCCQTHPSRLLSTLVIHFKLISIDIVQAVDPATNSQGRSISIHQIPKLTGRAFHFLRFTNQWSMDRLAGNLNPGGRKSNVGVLNGRSREFIAFLQANLHLVDTTCQTVRDLAVTLQVASWGCRCGVNVAAANSDPIPASYARCARQYDSESRVQSIGRIVVVAEILREVKTVGLNITRGGLEDLPCIDCGFFVVVVIRLGLNHAIRVNQFNNSVKAMSRAIDVDPDLAASDSGEAVNVHITRTVNKALQINSEAQIFIAPLLFLCQRANEFRF